MYDASHIALFRDRAEDFGSLLPADRECLKLIQQRVTNSVIRVHGYVALSRMLSVEIHAYNINGVSTVARLCPMLEKREYLQLNRAAADEIKLAVNEKK